MNGIAPYPALKIEGALTNGAIRGRVSTAHPLLEEIRTLLPAGFTVEATAASHGYRVGRALRSSPSTFDSRSRILEVAGGRWEVFRSAGRPTRSGPLPMRLDRPDAETVPQILELARREGVLPSEETR